MKTLKQKGNIGESIVRNYYENKGFYCSDQNFTIPGGEIDLVMQNDISAVFVEVKVVDYIGEGVYSLSQKKRQTLERSIDTYCYRKEIDKEIRLDIAFVQNEKIVEIYENITNT